MPWYLEWLAYYLLAGAVVSYLLIRSITKMIHNEEIVQEFGTQCINGKFSIVDRKKFALIFSIFTPTIIPVSLGMIVMIVFGL